MRTRHHSKGRERRKLHIGRIWLAALALLPSTHADVFTNDLCEGIDPAYWVIQSNQPLYTVAATTGGVRFSKPVSGDYSFQYVTLQSRLVAQGNFDVRVENARLRAYYSATLIYENDYNTNDASFAMPLQNNGTRDATAVTFANFQLAADHIVYQPLQFSIQLLPAARVLISWPANPSGYLLQSSPSLPGPGLWEAVTNSPVLTGNRLFVTNGVTDRRRRGCPSQRRYGGTVPVSPPPGLRGQRHRRGKRRDQRVARTGPAGDYRLRERFRATA